MHDVTCLRPIVSKYSNPSCTGESLPLEFFSFKGDITYLDKNRPTTCDNIKMKPEKYLQSWPCWI